MMTYSRRWIPYAAALLAFFHAPLANSGGEHDFLLFLSGGPTYHMVTPYEGLEEGDIDANADVLYTYLNGRFRLLGEYNQSIHESELERLQLGWQGGDETIGWIGRFHVPSNYWNTVYHHGQYLQTSITRPFINEFEDAGGVLPTHSTGFMLETAYGLAGTAGLQAALSVGTAPVIGRDSLEPFDLLNPDSSGRAAVDMRLAYLPDSLGENQAGLLVSGASLAVDGNKLAEQQGLQRVDQLTLAAYTDWRWQDWRLLANLTAVVNRMKRQDQDQTDSFFSGYVQPEYDFGRGWTLFGRLEATSNTNSSDYLELFPDSLTDRQMLGLRFDFYRNQAITIEISHGATIADDFGQALLQWSAVFP